jgi:Flp pilus assembly protein TadB
MRPPLARSAAVAACVAAIGVSAAGCSTTQEKAAKQQARAEHILKARAEREKANKRKKQHNKRHGKDGKDGKDNSKDKGGEA